MEDPYLFEEIVVKKRKYNPNYGDKRICKCGHPYDRHFDSQPSVFTRETMTPVGCKYCDCYVFMQKGEENAEPM
jgi:hypothetical protein